MNRANDWLAQAKRDLMQPKPSSNSVQIISLDRKLLLEQLHHIAEQLLREKPEVQDVRLFGSVSCGNATGLSDVDILLILKECTEKDPVRRILLYLPYFSIGRDVDLLVYTTDELHGFLASGNLFFQQIWNESISLGAPHDKVISPTDR